MRALRNLFVAAVVLVVLGSQMGSGCSSSSRTYDPDYREVDTGPRYGPPERQPYDDSLESRGYVFIGSRSVSRNLDYDVFPIGKSYGKFQLLKLQIEGGRVDLIGLTIVYENKTRQHLDVRHSFGPGSTTRSIDLVGDRRTLASVQVEYAARSGRPTVQLYGR